VLGDKQTPPVHPHGGQSYQVIRSSLSVAAC